MMTLEFKNGNKIKIEQGEASIIATLIQSPEGGNPWQCFSTTQNPKDTYLMLNLNEVAGIYSQENVL